jgi:hypothetical protein
MPLVTSALFAERNRRGREGRQGRPLAGEVKQESALVTAIISDKILGNDKIFCVFDCQQNCQQRSFNRVVPE